MQLRKSITFPVSTMEKSGEVIVNVSWDLLEKVERTYGTSAEYVATQILPNIFHVQRHKLAQLLQLWFQGRIAEEPKGVPQFSQIEIAEAIQTSSQEQFIRYIGMIQAAILWSIRGPEGLPLINDEQFDLLVAGKDIDASETPVQKAPEGSSDKPKKPRAATSKKRTP